MEKIPEDLFSPSETRVKVEEGKAARREAEVSSNKPFEKDVGKEEIETKESSSFFSEAEIRVAEEKEARRAEEKKTNERFK